MKWHREVDCIYCEHGNHRAYVGNSDIGYWWRIEETTYGHYEAISCNTRSTQRQAKRECEALLKAMEGEQ